MAHIQIINADIPKVGDIVYELKNVMYTPLNEGVKFGQALIGIDDLTVLTIDKFEKPYTVVIEDSVVREVDRNA